MYEISFVPVRKVLLEFSIRVERAMRLVSAPGGVFVPPADQNVSIGTWVNLDSVAVSEFAIGLRSVIIDSERSLEPCVAYHIFSFQLGFG